MLSIGAGLSLVLYMVALVSPATADAAQYAYVDNTGDVRSVTANDWRTAIATAPNIDEHSGVLLLDSVEDFEVVGDDVPSV